MDIFYPIQILADNISYNLFHFTRANILGSAINFFIYESIKIFLLLFVFIFISSFIRSYFPPEKMKKFLTKKFSLGGNILAALFGIITPFCSCSAVPLFIGMVESGVPLGVTFSFLISSPMVNEVALVMLFGLFGFQIGLLYAGTGVCIAIVVGYILGKMKLEHLVEGYVWKIKIQKQINQPTISTKERFPQAYAYTCEIIRKVYPYVLLGIAFGAFIHGYAPENFLAKIAGRNNLFSVPIAVLIGIPLYSNAAGTIPIIQSLLAKGLPLGTALAFMMSITALSLPEMIILRKVLKPKLLGIYISVLAIGIILTGYLFNVLL